MRLSQSCVSSKLPRKYVVIDYNINVVLASYYANFQPSSQEYVPAAPRTNGNTGMSFIQNQFIPDLAVRYGSAMFDEGANFVHKNVSFPFRTNCYQVDQYVNRFRIKYYFSVNNSYVAKKVGLILFPFAHTVSTVPVYFVF